MTVQVWLKAICRRRVFEQQADTPRVREAFAMLAERSRRWPTPADFLDALPNVVASLPKVARIEREERRERGMAHIGQITRILEGPAHARTDGNDPEPPRAA